MTKEDAVSTPEIDMMIIKAGNIEEAMMTKARGIDDMSKKTALDREKTANLTKDRATRTQHIDMLNTSTTLNK